MLGLENNADVYREIYIEYFYFINYFDEMLR